MATVKAFIRTGKKDREANIRFRISDGRNVQLYHKSELLILPSLWDEKREQYKAKCIVKTEDRIQLIQRYQIVKNYSFLSTMKPQT